MTTLLSRTLLSGGTVYACGNGGSHDQAGHLVGELIGRYRVERAPYPAVHLQPLSGIANDYGWEQVFARQLSALVKPRDLLVCLTTSGKSENVKRACLMAKAKGATVLAVIGAWAPASRHWWERAADEVIAVGQDTPSCQEATLALIHEWCRQLDEEVA